MIGRYYKAVEEDDGVIVHSAKGSHWKKHNYVGIDSRGNYIYNDEQGQTERAIRDVSDLTGMNFESVQHLNYLARTKGFDSKEYKEELFGLSGGDEDTQKKVDATLKAAKAHRLTGKDTPASAAGKKNVAEWEKEHGPNQRADEEKKKNAFRVKRAKARIDALLKQGK